MAQTTKPVALDATLQESNTKLEAIKEAIINSSTGGTSDYNNLFNKPKINGVDIKGNLDSEDIALSEDGNLSLSEHVNEKLAKIDENENDGFLKSTNLWDEEWEVGSLGSPTGEPYADSTVLRSKNFCRIDSGETYYIYVGVPINVVIYFYDNNKTYLGSEQRVIANNVSFVSPTNAYFFKLRTLGDYGAIYKHDIAIIKGTSGSYAPYAKSNVELTEELAVKKIVDLSGFAIVKHGNIATIMFSGYSTPNASTWTRFQTFEAPKPIIATNIFFEDINGADVYVNASGYIYYKGNSGNLYGTFTYICE